jgi:hypothetical protein
MWTRTPKMKWVSTRTLKNQDGRFTLGLPRLKKRHVHSWTAVSPPLGVLLQATVHFTTVFALGVMTAVGGRRRTSNRVMHGAACDVIGWRCRLDALALSS